MNHTKSSIDSAPTRTVLRRALRNSRDLNEFIAILDAAVTAMIRTYNFSPDSSTQPLDKSESVQRLDTAMLDALTQGDFSHAADLALSLLPLLITSWTAAAIESIRREQQL